MCIYDETCDVHLKKKTNIRCNNISVRCVAIFFTWFFDLFILTLKFVCCNEFVNTFRTPFFMLGPRKHRILLLNANKKKKRKKNQTEKKEEPFGYCKYGWRLLQIPLLNLNNCHINLLCAALSHRIKVIFFF